MVVFQFLIIQHGFEPVVGSINTGKETQFFNAFAEGDDIFGPLFFADVVGTAVFIRVGIFGVNKERIREMVWADLFTNPVRLLTGFRFIDGLIEDVEAKIHLVFNGFICVKEEFFIQGKGSGNVGSVADADNDIFILIRGKGEINGIVV